MSRENEQVIARTRGEPIMLGAMNIKDGVVTLRLKAPRTVEFETAPAHEPTLLGLKTGFSGSFRLPHHLAIDQKMLNDVDLVDVTGSGLLMPDDRDDKHRNVVLEEIARGWTGYAMIHATEIHEARLNSAEDFALNRMAYRADQLDPAATDMKTARRECASHAMRELATVDADLWSSPAALSARPGYVATRDGKLLGKPGWQPYGARGWITQHVHEHWSRAADAASRQDGTVHRIRIARDDVLLVTATGFRVGMARPDTTWPEGPVIAPLELMEYA